jgi:MoaA/NifB/PqqE/SkfB family radical SAM enzyme
MPFKTLRPPPGLRGAVFSEEEKEKARHSYRLLFISLMTSNHCNLCCPDCYSAGSPSSGDPLLSSKERRDVLRQAQDLGARTLRIAGEGEPLLDSGFWDLIDCASELGMDVFFFTNGTLVSPAVAQRIARYGNLTMVMKFSGDPKTMEALTGEKGFFRKHQFVKHDGLNIPIYLRNAIDAGLSQVDSDGNTRLGIEFLLRRANQCFAVDIYRWARQNHIVPYFEQNLEAGRALTWNQYEHQRISDLDALDLSRTFLAIDEAEFGFTWSPSVPYLVGGICETEVDGCNKFSYNIVISPIGYAYPCYATYINIGCVRKMPLCAILEHPYRKQLLGTPHFKCLCRVYSRTILKRTIESPDDLDNSNDY